jgi:hypothetical protein
LADDIRHAVGVVVDTLDPDLCKLHHTYCNTASQLRLTNENGASLVTGDVAVLDAAVTESVVEASSATPYRPGFVVPYDIGMGGDAITKTILDTEAGWMCKPGSYVTIAPVDGAVAIGEYLAYSATAKKYTGTDCFTCRPINGQAIALAAALAAGNIPILVLAPSPQLCRRARVYKSTDTAVGAGAYTPVAFDTEVYDVGGLHNPANPERFTIPAGTPTYTYAIDGTVAFDAVESGSLLIRLNGGDSYAWMLNETTTALTVATQMQLAAADYVELVVYTAGAANIKYYADYSPFFAITQIGE